MYIDYLLTTKMSLNKVRGASLYSNKSDQCEQKRVSNFHLHNRKTYLQISREPPHKCFTLTISQIIQNPRLKDLMEFLFAEIFLPLVKGRPIPAPFRVGGGGGDERMRGRLQWTNPMALSSLRSLTDHFLANILIISYQPITSYSKDF